MLGVYVCDRERAEGGQHGGSLLEMKMRIWQKCQMGQFPNLERHPSLFCSLWLSCSLFVFSYSHSSCLPVISQFIIFSLPFPFPSPSRLLSFLPRCLPFPPLFLYKKPKWPHCYFAMNHAGLLVHHTLNGMSYNHSLKTQFTAHHSCNL